MDLQATRHALKKLRRWASEGKLDAKKVERLKAVLKTRLGSDLKSVTNGV